MLENDKIPHNGTATSKTTARRVSRKLRSESAQKILRCLLAEKRLGMTSQQIEAKIGLSGDSVRPILLSLEARGFVYRTDLTRATKSGNLAQVWFVEDIPDGTLDEAES